MAKKSINAIKTVVLKAKNVVEKQNILNEMKSTYMTVQEVRFLSIYLSKINVRDKNTRIVKFPLSDFTAILDIKKVNVSSMQETTDRLLGKVINIPDGNGGYVGFQLFKRCRVYKDVGGYWHIEIDAHDDALPLLFDFKQNYFKYFVGNILRLSSTNQQRMYEILKQYEKLGTRAVTVKELRDLIGITDLEYPAFKDFRKCVLDSCKLALKENTDICYEYELIKRGRGSKVVEIKFIISKNYEFAGQMTVDEWTKEKNDKIVDMVGQDMELDEEEENDDDFNEKSWANRMKFFSEAFNDEFSIAQIEVLYKLAMPTVEGKKHRYGFDTSMYDYLTYKLSELNSKYNVMHRFNYIKRLIELDNE